MPAPTYYPLRLLMIEQKALCNRIKEALGRRFIGNECQQSALVLFREHFFASLQRMASFFV
jgi:hypothetical protein